MHDVHLKHLYVSPFSCRHISACVINYLFSCDTATARERLDRRRLETAHFRYAILVVTKCYHGDIDPGVRFYPEINETLLGFTPIYHLAFHRKYSGQLV